ncbi:hypothetical protein R6Q57_006097 [Mikania cordata]
MDPVSSWVQERHFPNLHIPISIEKLFAVKPEGPIQARDGDTLFLSNLDDIIGARVFTPTIYFYLVSKSTIDDVVGILKNALAKVLVPYYPFSGRLRETKNRKLEVFFGPNQGALIVQAYTELSLDHLGDLNVPNPAWSNLVYKFPEESDYKVIDMPLLIAQVTRFSCGGFSLGLRICHCICDGLGAMQFLGAWASTAKTSFLVVEPKPCWDREVFKPRNPPMVKYPHIEFIKIHDISNLTNSLWEVKPLQKCYWLSREFQTHLKSVARPMDSLGCTTFDAMAAHVWRSWVKALNIKPLDFRLRLTFPVNARTKLKNPPLKEGFYGNVVCVACATSTVSNLINGSLQDVTRLVREARLEVSEEYLRSTIDYVEVDRPNMLEFGGKLTITQWTRFSMYETSDFGWGRAIYVGPLDLTPTPQVCVLLPEGVVNYNGAMVVCICLPEAAANRFKELLCLMETS